MFIGIFSDPGILLQFSDVSGLLPTYSLPLMVKKNGAAPFVYLFEDPKAVMGGASFLVLLGHESQGKYKAPGGYSPPSQVQKFRRSYGAPGNTGEESPLVPSGSFRFNPSRRAVLSWSSETGFSFPRDLLQQATWEFHFPFRRRGRSDAGPRKFRGRSFAGGCDHLRGLSAAAGLVKSQEVLGSSPPRKDTKRPARSHRYHSASWRHSFAESRTCDCVRD